MFMTFKLDALVRATAVHASCLHPSSMFLPLLRAMIVEGRWPYGLDPAAEEAEKGIPRALVVTWPTHTPV